MEICNINNRYSKYTTLQVLMMKRFDARDAYAGEPPNKKKTVGKSHHR